MHSPLPQFTDEQILQLRPSKNKVEPNRPYAFLVESERSESGRVEDVLTVFLTNRECPFRCLYCDLWKNTLDERLSPGMIPEQIRFAMNECPPAQHIKLYNSGNFFDLNAIPPEDYAEIAVLIADFETVIVESHPLLIGRRCWEFQEKLRPKLHVAMGLETVHPEVLSRLNKRMTLEDFSRATKELLERGISVRTFILLRPPFLSESEGVYWAKRSIDFAFDNGVECCAVIPTRAGNGIMEQLERDGLFASPTLDSLEEVHEYGLSRNSGRVFVDLWDSERLFANIPNARARIDRLARMNLTQLIEPLSALRVASAST